MPRFAANLSMMFGEVPFLDRFGAAAEAGFEAVEFLFPYEHPPEEIARRLHAGRLRNVLFNLPPGNWGAGERGIGAVPGREREFRDGIATALRYAEALGTPTLHAMAGLVPAGVDRARCRATYLENLRLAARETAAKGLTLVIEPINTRDIPGYFLNRQDHAHELVQQVGAPNLKVQMDLYHCQIVEGDVAMKLRKYLPTGHVGHLQIAGVPDRHEPDLGELHHPYLFKLIDELGWTGHIGCEYRPRGRTSAGLGWLRNAQQAQGDLR